MKRKQNKIDARLRAAKKEANELSVKDLRAHYAASLANWQESLDQRDASYALIRKIVTSMSAYELAGFLQRLIK